MPPEVLALLARHRAEVGRILDTTSDEVLAAWIRAWGDIEADLIRDAFPDEPAERRARLTLARRRASQRILTLAANTNTTVTAAARTLIERSLWEQPELIAAQMPVAAAAQFARPPAAELDAMIHRTAEQITARHYALAADATAAMKRSLVLGTAAGDNPRDVAEQIIARARTGFDGGIARAQVIARTEMIDAHRAAAKASQDANADLLTGWRWWAQLGPRTCPSCVAQHGRLHDLDEPGPLDHHQGRCARLPVTKTWRDLGFPLDEPTRPPVKLGSEWFADQPEAVQRSILGDKRFDAWKAGDYPVTTWSQKRSARGWRDAYHARPAPTAPAARS